MFIVFSEDRTLWTPIKNSKVCSVHFVGEKRSIDQRHPDYVPSIFSSVYMKKRKSRADISRYVRASKKCKHIRDFENNIEVVENVNEYQVSVQKTSTVATQACMNSPDCSSGYVFYSTSDGNNLSTQFKIDNSFVIKGDVCDAFYLFNINKDVLKDWFSSDIGSRHICHNCLRKKIDFFIV